MLIVCLGLGLVSQAEPSRAPKEDIGHLYNANGELRDHAKWSDKEEEDAYHRYVYNKSRMKSSHSPWDDEVVDDYDLEHLPPDHEALKDTRSDIGWNRERDTRKNKNKKSYIEIDYEESSDRLRGQHYQVDLNKNKPQNRVLTNIKFKNKNEDRKDGDPRSGREIAREREAQRRRSSRNREDGGWVVGSVIFFLFAACGAALMVYLFKFIKTDDRGEEAASIVSGDSCERQKYIQLPPKPRYY